MLKEIIYKVQFLNFLISVSFCLFSFNFDDVLLLLSLLFCYLVTFVVIKTFKLWWCCCFSNHKVVEWSSAVNIMYLWFFYHYSNQNKTKTKKKKKSWCLFSIHSLIYHYNDTNTNNSENNFVVRLFIFYFFNYITYITII
jgi:hypothetical protein